jgi:hypothetical protein
VLEILLLEVADEGPVLGFSGQDASLSFDGWMDPVDENRFGFSVSSL